MHLRLDFSWQIKKLVETNQKDSFIELYSSEKSIKQLGQMGIRITAGTRIKPRVVCLLLSTGEKELLLTNLMDRSRYSSGELKDLYNMRWG